MSVGGQYKAALGANLRALWHASSGMALQSGTSYLASWTDCVGGFVANPSTPSAVAPSLLPDGSYFKAKPVVQFSQSGRFLTASTPGLVAANGRPYLFAVYRYRSTAGNYPYVVALPNDLMVIYTSGSGQKERGYIIANGSAVAIDSSLTMETGQHFSELYLDGSKAKFVHDGVPYSVANSGVIVPAIDSVQMGRAGEGDISLMMAGLCTAMPSAGELAALQALVASDST